jgi:hypothetical protein
VRVANGVEFELHVQEHALQISTHSAEVLRQSLDTLMGVGQAEQQRTELRQIASHVCLKDGEEDVIFIFEIIVKGAASFSCAQSNVFDAGMFESVASKNMSRGFNEFLPGDDAAPLALPFFAVTYDFCIHLALPGV